MEVCATVEAAPDSLLKEEPLLFHSEGCWPSMYQASRVSSPRSQREGQAAAGLQNTECGACPWAVASAQPHVPAVQRGHC